MSSSKKNHPTFLIPLAKWWSNSSQEKSPETKHAAFSNEFFPSELSPSWLSNNKKELAALKLSWSWKEFFLRRVVGPILNALPYFLYRQVTDQIKKRRHKKSKRETLYFNYQLMEELREVFPKEKTFSRNFTTVCLTHDIDTSHCAAFSPEVASLEKSFSLRSTFNLLTEGPYPLDLKWLDHLEEEGFEVGLHGDYHDLAFGFRSSTQIRKRLEKCLAKLARPISGYRAPALCISDKLLQELDKLGFIYDSSIKFQGFYPKGINLCLPYNYPSTSLWEFPLTIQDDGLFRDRSLSDEEALSLVQEVVQKISPFSGLVIINTHPCHLAKHLSFYQNLLQFLQEDDGVQVKLAREVAIDLSL